MSTGPTRFGGEPWITRASFGRSPGVSVIVPVRNRASLLSRAVHSILNQSHAVLEVIVVDDRSTDETWGVATALAVSDSRVVPLRNQGRGGAQSARNTGIRAARGEWIAFLDSDDYWLPDSLEARLAAAAVNCVAVVHSDCLVSRAGQPTAQWKLPALRGNVLKALFGAPSPMFQGLLVTRNALDSIGLLDEDIVAFQEWDTAIGLAAHFEFAFVDAPTFVYDCTGGDTISADLTKSAKGYTQVVRKHQEEILTALGPEALDKHYLVLAGMFSAAHDFRGVLWSLARLARSSSGRHQLPKVAFSAARPWVVQARTRLGSARRAIRRSYGKGPGPGRTL